jgi:hypothetical protein
VRREPVAVEVLHGDTWYSGWMLDSRQDGDACLMFVRYRTVPGVTHLLWTPGFRVRTRQDGARPNAKPSGGPTGSTAHR